MSARDEILRFDPPLARRRPVDEAPRRDAVAARLARSPGRESSRAAARARRRNASATFKAEAARAQASRRRSRRRPPTSPPRSRASCAKTICRRRCASARTRAWRDALGGDRARNLARALRRRRSQCGRAPPSPRWRKPERLALVSGPANPTTLNFLPDNHFVVVFADDLVGDYESVFAKLRAAYGAGAAPRTLNFITGPSRSADIEQTLLLGAHGPRRLHIVVVGASPEAGAAK